MRQQRAKTSRTGQRAIQLAGSAAKGSLDLDLVFCFCPLFQQRRRGFGREKSGATSALESRDFHLSSKKRWWIRSMTFPGTGEPSP